MHMKARLSRWLRPVPFLLALGLFAWMLRSVDLGRALGLAASLGPVLPLLLLPNLVAVAAETQGWRVALEAIGRPVRFVALLRVRLAADAVAMSVPSGPVVAETLQPYLLKRACQVPFEQAVVGIVARKFFVVLSHAIFLGAAVLAGWATLARASREIIGRPGLPSLLLGTAAALLVVASAIAATSVHGSVAERARGGLERLGRTRLRSWLERSAHRFRETDERLAGFFSRPGALARPLPWFVISWMVKSAETMLVLTLLGARVDLAAAVVEPALILVRVLAAPVPAGLGVQDLGYLLFLRGFAVPNGATIAAAFVVVKRGKDAFWTALGYALLLFERSRRVGQDAVGQPDVE
jgi:uncharacterized membrane protein YbhN (UPF0104 family)